MKTLLLIAVVIGLTGCVEKDNNEKTCHSLFNELYDTTSETQQIQRETIKMLQTELSASRREVIELQLKVNEMENFKHILDSMKEGA